MPLPTPPLPQFPSSSGSGLTEWDEEDSCEVRFVWDQGQEV